MNEIRLSGTIHKLYRLKTKAGAPMTKVLLKVKQETFWVLGYGNVASAITALKEGDPLAISGTAQMNNWRDESGDWHNDFNAVAWAAEINGQQVKYEKKGQKKPQEQARQSEFPPDRSQDDLPPLSTGPF